MTTTTDPATTVPPTKEAVPPPPQNNPGVLESQPNVSQPKYDRLSNTRKLALLTLLCYLGFLTPLSSTAILVAIPNVSETYHTTGVIINISQAMFFIFMAISPIFWGPISQSFGRRPVFLISSVFLTAFSAGTALADTVAGYFVMRMITAFQGTAFLVTGSVVIGDCFHPEERGRALGWFMSGILIGPTIAPLLGGIVITYTSWKVVYWVITVLSGIATALIVFFLPETIPEKPTTFEGLSRGQAVKKLGKAMSPLKVIRPLISYPNLYIAALAVSSLIWNQYSILTPIRYVLNPRFKLTSPLQSALFFLPPGVGYLVGTFFGGSWSDYIVKKYITKRDGRRVPEDRLNAAVVLMAIFIPGFMIAYGWAVEKEAGGIPLVVIVMFLQAFTQSVVLPSLNTYVIDVLQDKGLSSVAVAGNYLTRFIFAAGASAVCLPAIKGIGVGWFSTICGLFISCMAGLVWLLTKYGEAWRLKTEKDAEPGHSDV